MAAVLSDTLSLTAPRSTAAAKKKTNKQIRPAIQCFPFIQKAPFNGIFALFYPFIHTFHSFKSC